MPKSTATRRCARCGHPYNKHTHKPNPGCAMRYYKKSAGRFEDCQCPGFVEGTK